MIPHPARPWLTIGLAIGLVACPGPPASAQVAAPGDVYYRVHVDQRFQYYVFSYSVVPWENRDLAGTSLTSSATHDSALAYGVLGVTSSFDANAGVFTADLESHITLDARTGIYHLLTNTLGVDVYIKGNTGTPYWLSVSGTGLLDASRLGGTSGTLQPLNGTSSASFMDSTAFVDYTGAVAKPLDDSTFVSGLTTTAILVGADTYSLAGTYAFRAPAAVTQSICVLGCMATPATFHAAAAGHVAIEVFPYATPLDVTPGPGRPGGLWVDCSPNPLRSAATVSFRATAGERTRVEVFDVRGRRVTGIYDGPATGAVQRAPWRAGSLPEGLYFVRIRSGSRAWTAKTARLR